MATQTKTVGGRIERGTAMQRHFARAVDSDVEGARVVCSFGSGEVSVSVEDGSLTDVMDLADEWGIDVELDGEVDKRFPTGRLAVTASL